jgi:hypothetical protein
LHPLGEHRWMNWRTLTVPRSPSTSWWFATIDTWILATTYHTGISRRDRGRKPQPTYKSRSGPQKTWLDEYPPFYFQLQ